MHGLGTHGASGHQGLTHGLMPQVAAQPTAQPTAPAALDTTHHRAGETLAESASGAGTSVRPAPAGSTSSSASLLTMCLAFLGGLLALAATLLLKSFGWRSRALCARFVSAYVADRDRDPPCLVRLSVLRC